MTDPGRRRAIVGAIASLALVITALAVTACAGSASPGGSAAPSSTEATPMAATTPPTTSLVLTSTAFAEGQAVPPRHSCRGEDVSPPLAWQGVPAGTAALVLFVDDPDGRDWVHWSVLDLPPEDGGLPEGVAPAADPPRQGRNDFGRVGYGGPCPPSGVHHYRFTLYALAAPLGLTGHPDGAAVRRALAGATILGQVTLVGTFRA